MIGGTFSQVKRFGHRPFAAKRRAIIRILSVSSAMKLIENTERQGIGADEVVHRDLVNNSGLLLIKTANSEARRWG
ncbi:MAG: hypothetical protein C5B57_10850 [Blastocatellia bacterium]|nr:MAG: hypothetical protein C5B57_10850 [Blastocatellia bacterium]